ncbi:carbon monoxide dehydrogenase maturation protein [Geovibrio thiophilus]|uniref:Carbon monoxide dehydrogenase maturation protein n=1 Tax=Geovibrio thiophilus TaxID=139438 RepID=A0A3R5Y6A7_9BACT|nr:AAA family ATPase [Geovibrio thiophilus]QAR32686.1 carbon monoxide dehydrogenase maturation protein [Geovibrio thiophilus]
MKSDKELLCRNTRIYAVCGKGGVGKTAFTALLTRALAERKSTGRLLVIDADPALGLANALGIKISKTIGQVREAVIQTAKDGIETEIQEMAGMLDYLLLETLVEGNGFALLAMGRSESMGCYCSVNNLLRDAINELSDKFDTILIDGEAGLEQINRQVVETLDYLIILSDSSARGLQTVGLIKKMTEEDKVISCKSIGLVFNRVNSINEMLRRTANEIGINILGVIPNSEQLADFDMRSIALTGLPKHNEAYEAIDTILEQLINRANF